MQNVGPSIYTSNIDEILVEYHTDKQHGLTDVQVIANGIKYGQNKLATKKNKPLIKIFLEQYKDLLMIVLLVASLISLFVGIFPVDGIHWGTALQTIDGWENFILIVGVTIINAILGTVQIVKSQKSLDGLKKLSQPKTKVIRNNISQIIDTASIVVGDLVILEAGDLIPADLRLIDVNNLKVNESSLTGESETVLKTSNVLLDNNLSLGDQINCAFSGSLVTFGKAFGIVYAVGIDTEIGKINTLLNATSEKKTPLQINLDKLAKFLMFAVLILCSVLFAVNISKLAFLDPITLTSGMAVFSDTLNFSIALAVAVIPEALSSIVTIVLSISTKKMSKLGAIVKELKAVEGLGSVSIICSDKTGTLTQNHMTVSNFYTNNAIFSANNLDISNANHYKLMIYGVLGSDAKIKEEKIIGDPTEISLVEFVQKHKIDSNQLNIDFPRISEIPFDSERMMMSTLIKEKNQNVMIVKGALENLLKHIKEINIDGKIQPITELDKQNIYKANLEFSKKGERVLCFGYKNTTLNKIQLQDEDDLVFLGLMTMIDPPRPEVIQAIKECQVSGIKVVMITGDHEITATAIAQQIGLSQPTDKTMNGTTLSQINEQELSQIVDQYAVYARVSPFDKIKIVNAWQSQNMIVSMTGDGVNDAPALKQANIGVAMGITGTEVSKDAASIILTDDNFATIVNAIKFGRSVYNNIKSAIRFLLTGNLSTVFITIILTIFSLSIQIVISPFSAIQLLFLNLLTDSWPAIALGLEKYRGDVIYEKPRKANEFFITKKFSLNILWDSLIMTAIVTISFFLVYLLADQTNDTVRFQNASGMAFMTLAFCRVMHGFNCKNDHFTLFKKTMFDNQYLIGSLFLEIALISLVFYTPGIIKLMFGFNEFIVFKPSMIWIALSISFALVPCVQLSKYLEFGKKQMQNVVLL